MQPMQNVSVQMKRNASLDAARGVLMMLGVLLHTANIYTTSGNWLIADSARSEFFDWVSEFVHVFRMPAFFWISGFFCAFTFHRNGSNGLISKRLPRLALPLLGAWFFLNVPQDVVLALWNGASVRSALLDGVPLYHLWFLVDLLVFIVFAAFLMPRLSMPQNMIKIFSASPLWLMFLVFAAISVLGTIIVRTSGFAYENLAGLTSLFRLASYAPFFAIGALMYNHKVVHDKFLGLPAFFVFIAVPLAIVAGRFTSGHGLVVGEVALFAEYIMVWVAVAATIKVFYLLFKQNTAVTRFLSDAAYTVFLFHHVIVVLLGTLLISMDIPLFAKFMIVTVLSFVFSALIHLLIIQKNVCLRLIFNGK